MEARTAALRPLKPLGPERGSDLKLGDRVRALHDEDIPYPEREGEIVAIEDRTATICDSDGQTVSWKLRHLKLLARRTSGD